jgi:hypothetical protein
MSTVIAVELMLASSRLFAFLWGERKRVAVLEAKQVLDVRNGR